MRLRPLLLVPFFAVPQLRGAPEPPPPRPAPAAAVEDLRPDIPSPVEPPAPAPPAAAPRERSAAERLDGASPAELADLLLTTPDDALAAALVRGARERPDLLARAARGLSLALRARLARRDDPELLGALADVARLGGEEVRDEGLRHFLRGYLDLRRDPELRLRAAEGLMAWPDGGRSELLAWYPAEPSGEVRASLLRLFAPEALLEAARVDPDPLVRRFAAERLRLGGDRRALPSLQSLLAGESDPAVAAALRETLEFVAARNPDRRVPSRRPPGR